MSTNLDNINIISSYFDGKYPWTRLGYTYDWADNGEEYGLSEFVVRKNSEVKVAYTVDQETMLKKMDESSWRPETEKSTGQTFGWSCTFFVISLKEKTHISTGVHFPVLLY